MDRKLLRTLARCRRVLCEIYALPEGTLPPESLLQLVLADDARPALLLVDPDSQAWLAGGAARASVGPVVLAVVRVARLKRFNSPFNSDFRRRL